MRVSQKAEYALRAMLEMARSYGLPGPLRSGEIARRQQIPEKFLELILVELRRGGLVSSLRGPVGGHRLARDPSRITVGDVWRLIDAAAAETHRNGSGGPDDPFGTIWEGVDRAVTGVVDSVTLEDVRVNHDGRPSVPDFAI